MGSTVDTTHDSTEQRRTDGEPTRDHYNERQTTTNDGTTADVLNVAQLVYYCDIGFAHKYTIKLNQSCHKHNIYHAFKRSKRRPVQTCSELSRSELIRRLAHRQHSTPNQNNENNGGQCEVTSHRSSLISKNQQLDSDFYVNILLINEQ